jgi:hypothetical protein
MPSRIRLRRQAMSRLGVRVSTRTKVKKIPIPDHGPYPRKNVP